MAPKEPQEYAERVSLAPVIDYEEQSINGTSEVTFTVQHEQPRAILIVQGWQSADNLLVKFVGSDSFTIISSVAAQAMGVGAVYPFAIASFKSSGNNETNFKIAALY